MVGGRTSFVGPINVGAIVGADVVGDDVEEAIVGFIVVDSVVGAAVSNSTSYKRQSSIDGLIC